MNTRKQTEKIFEIGAEGGSLTVKRSFIGVGSKSTNDDPKVIFSWIENSSMGLEDDEWGMSSSGGQFFKFHELLDSLLEKYPEIFKLYALFIHKDYKHTLAEKIRSLIGKGELKISEMYSLESWLNELEITKDELIDGSTFQSNELLAVLDKFSKNNLDIMEEKGWNRLEFLHSDFKTVPNFSKYLENNNLKNVYGYFCDLNKSGVYVYFHGQQCLYIGKAKKLKDRIINHYKSSHNYINKNNPNDGRGQRKLFNDYLNNPLILFYFEMDNKYNSKVGELLRKTIEGMLQLKYKPEYDKKTNMIEKIEISEIWNGYCPESLLNGKRVRMRLNRSDFFESEETGLQICIFGIFAIILNFRGKGKFRTTLTYGDEVENAQVLSPQNSEKRPFNDPTTIFGESKEIVKYIATIQPKC